MKKEKRGSDAKEESPMKSGATGGGLTPGPAKAKPSSLLDTRVIYCGDNLEQLEKFPDECVDLIYIDPPFNSNRNYEVFWGEAREKRAFEDRHASTQAYLDFMRPRCVELARVLKKTGSFYYHCDWHASHYVKVMLDQIFGENNFQNEIVWKRTHSHGGAKGFGSIHDVILYYALSKDFVWNSQYVPYSDEYRENFFRFEDPDGRRYRATILTGPGTRKGSSGLPWRNVNPTAVGRHWAVPGYVRKLLPNQEDSTVQMILDQLDKTGRIIWPAKKGGTPSFKQYIDDMEGAPIHDLWTDIPPIPAAAQERLGYPTQKPLALLERIINASSNKNDIILDAFCGCGTALVAAENLGRQWIGIDISPTACRVMAKRLRDVCSMREDKNLWLAGRGFVVRDLPWSEAQLRKLPPFEFENWAVIALGGVTNPAKVGDMGIDGRIYPVHAMPKKSGKAAGELHFMDDWYPIQVKQKDKAGRPDIDSFESAMRHADRTKGFFVSFDYTSDALTQIDSFFRKAAVFEVKSFFVAMEFGSLTLS
jgi:site-specific DNA-methyltransferase (adenine-specific)